MFTARVTSIRASVSGLPTSRTIRSTSSSVACSTAPAACVSAVARTVACPPAHSFAASRAVVNAEAHRLSSAAGSSTTTSSRSWGDRLVTVAALNAYLRALPLHATTKRASSQAPVVESGMAAALARGGGGQVCRAVLRGEDARQPSSARRRNMSRSARLSACVAAIALSVLSLVGVALPAAAAAADPFTMTATSYTSGFSPAYVGNGYVGTRVPAQGMGYVAGATVPTTTIVAGVWQQTPAQDVVSAAPLPGWDELRFTDGGTDYSLSYGTVSNWTQTVDMHTGAISTSLDWTSPAGHTTHLAYDVLADLAQPNVATVRLRLTPAWSGSARVTDVLGSGASTDLVPMSSNSVPGHRLVTLAVRTQGTGVTVAYASRLGFTAKTLAMTGANGSRDASLAVDFAVQAGKTYEFTKAVGIATSQDSADPQKTADTKSAGADSTGFDGLLAESQRAWADRWQSDIVLPDDPTLQRQIRAAQFYLQESIRPGTDWSISPVGLSSSGYNDHVFWDAETWMCPSLLLLHPAWRRASSTTG